MIYRATIHKVVAPSGDNLISEKSEGQIAMDAGAITRITYTGGRTPEEGLEYTIRGTYTKPDGPVAPIAFTTECIACVGAGPPRIFG